MLLLVDAQAALVEQCCQRLARDGAAEACAPAPASTPSVLAFSGGITAGPLLLFAYGARQVPLTSLGVLQYIAPTMQFLIGVLLYGESFTPSRIIGFSLIWLALALYWRDSFRQRGRSATA